MDTVTGSNPTVLNEGLEALLVEVNGLANRLKATDPRVAIPVASRSALQILQRYGPQTVPQIARARFSSRQNIQILINRLKEEGLVELVTNPEHKRSALVRLTERGHAAIVQATAEESKLSTELLPAFSQIELSSATEVLNKLRKLLDGKEKPDNHGSVKPEERSQNRDELYEAQLSPEKPISKFPVSEVTDDGELPVSLL